MCGVCSPLLHKCRPTVFIHKYNSCTVGRDDALHVRPKGYGFNSRSSRHVGTLGKSFTRSYLWRFAMKFRHSVCAVSGTPLSSSGLEETLQK